MPAPESAQEALVDEDVPVLDVEGAIARMGVERQVYRDVLGIFPDEYASLMQRLHSALSRHAQEDAVREAHTLKGLAANFGAEQLRAAAWALEQALRAGAVDPQSLLQATDAAAQRLMQRLAQGVD